MASLALRHCSPLKKGTNPIRESLAHSLLAQIDPAWHIAKDKKSISREFTFADFHQTIGFVNTIAWIANQENHHPEMEVGYKRCLVRYTSHAADGLTVNDFISAAKADTLYSGNVPAEHPTGKTRQPAEAAEAADTGNGDAAEKPAPTGKTPAPALNLEEASELLDKTLERPDQNAQTADDDEDEFELIDPAEQLKAEAAAERAAEQTQQIPAVDSKASPKESEPVKQESAGSKPPEQDIDLMATVILPPGMESVSPAKDEDEDATVILPADQADTGQPESPKTGAGASAQETRIDPPPVEDLDDEKTMIIRPPDMQSEQTRPATSQATPRQSGTDQPDASTQPRTAASTAQKETAPAASAPHNNDRPVSPKPNPAAPDKPQTPPAGRQPPGARPPASSGAEQPSDTSNKPAAAAPPNRQSESAEENAERTMALTSDPLGRTNRNKTTGESGAATGGSQPATKKPAPTAAKERHKDDKAEPGIEEDETLVMHSNTYKPVKKGG